MGWKQVTVAQLIEGLTTMPQDALVSIEGCDCDGVAIGIDLEKDGSVFIRRSGGVVGDDEAPTWNLGRCTHPGVDDGDRCPICDTWVDRDDDQVLPDQGSTEGD